MVAPKLKVIIFVCINSLTIQNTELKIFIVHESIDSLKCEFVFCSKTERVFYTFCFFIKIFILLNTYNTVQATTYMISNIFISYSSRTKKLKIIFKYFKKQKVLKFFHILSL